MTQRIFISADHGMAIIYFLQSDVVTTLLAAGVEIVLLTDDETKDKIAARFSQPGLIFEGLRLKQASAYADGYKIPAAMAARIPAAGLAARGAHQQRSHGQSYLGGVDRELVEVPARLVDPGCRWRS